MIMPEAVMKPAITGWLRKLARKPSFKTPISISMRPEMKASVIAATTICPGSLMPRLAIAAAVIKETTATGPTAKARLVPKTA